MADACIGLGANLGDPYKALVAANRAIADLASTRVTGRSRLYRSAPVGPGEQPPYLNAALRVDTALEAHDLLAALQAIETAAGRVRTERWGPRTLDLDLLTYGTARIEDETLTIPHPRLAERNFVLAPLIDLLGPEAEVAGGRLQDWLRRAPANPLEVSARTWECGTRDCA